LFYDRKFRINIEIKETNFIINEEFGFLIKESKLEVLRALKIIVSILKDGIIFAKY